MLNGLDTRFTTLAARLHQQMRAMPGREWTKSRDEYQTIRLEKGRVPPECPIAGDRCDREPQMKALEC